MFEFITLDVNNQITESMNWAFVTIGVVTNIFLFYEYKSGSVSESNKQAILFLMLMITSVIIRIGYWGLAIKYAPIGETYSPDFKQWKWLMTLSTALLFSYSCTSFIGFFRCMSLANKVIIFNLSFISAILIGFL